ncbi:MAG: beta-N-acetylhexosaminidase [Clostridiales bacterium]|nr:beta-N-acetylhexosaminidase [Clostridiales bacterium]
MKKASKAANPSQRKCIFKKKQLPPVYEAMLIPKPYGYQPLNGCFVINKDTLLIVDPKRKTLAEAFQSMFFRALGHNLYIHYNKPGHNNILFEENSAIDAEGYTIECYPDRIKITFGGAPGFFYAMQSVRQILKLDKRLYEDSINFPCMIITDVPKYRYRGFMLDVSRHFYDKTEVKRYIDFLALLKFNVFHWHLSDDQGFRFEIKKYPFINMTASQRLSDCVARSEADSPYVDGVYKGYYTKEDIKEVVDYAKERFITVIPEIDMPGHVQALIAAYPWLSCTGERVDVRVEYGVSEEALCVGQETTYQFLKDILDELFELFDGPYFHLGGDEVVPNNWQNCPHCKKLMEDKGLADFSALQTYFINRIAEYCNQKGKTVIGWNDGIKAGADKKIISQFWVENPERNAELASQIADLDRKVIISSEKGFYCDYPYAKLPLKTTYFYGLPDELANPEFEKNILGVEAPLWTEYVLSRDKADLNCFPRLFAVAEQAWTRQNNPEEDGVRCKHKLKKLVDARYKRFLYRAEAVENILDCFRVNYAETKLADPENKKYKKIEVLKWHGIDQYSELKMNKNLKDQRKKVKENQKLLDRAQAEILLEHTLASIDTMPVKDVMIDVPYDRDLLD